MTQEGFFLAYEVKILLGVYVCFIDTLTPLSLSLCMWDLINVRKTSIFLLNVSLVKICMIITFLRVNFHSYSMNSVLLLCQGDVSQCVECSRKRNNLSILSSYCLPFYINEQFKDLEQSIFSNFG